MIADLYLLIYLLLFILGIIFVPILPGLLVESFINRRLELRFPTNRFLPIVPYILSGIGGFLLMSRVYIGMLLAVDEIFRCVVGCLVVDSFFPVSYEQVHHELWLQLITPPFVGPVCYDSAAVCDTVQTFVVKNRWLPALYQGARWIGYGMNWLCFGVPHIFVFAGVKRLFIRLQLEQRGANRRFRYIID